MPSPDDKIESQKQWNTNPCGAASAHGFEPGSAAFYQKVETERYETYAPWLKDAIDFPSFVGLRLLEIGTGLGTDHLQFARAGARTFAIDLTVAHLRLTRRRFALEGLVTRLARADAERLPFADGSFDAVYSFGVLHHTPDTQRAIDEVRRVLLPGGVAVVSLYHRHSAFYWISTMLCRGVRRGELWKKGYRRLMASIEHGSEASGAVPLVKVLSRRQCRRMFTRYASVHIRSDHIDYSHVFPSRSPSVGARRRRLENWAGYWGWYLTVVARK
jgi:ubiquinone/menaquinone biosynthesis C-methylase UbiE